jgi:hypothetical protein
VHQGARRAMFPSTFWKVSVILLEKIGLTISPSSTRTALNLLLPVKMPCCGWVCGCSGAPV